MSSRRFVISTAICIAAIYGAYYEQAGYDPAAEAAKARAVYENMARGDAAEAYRRCKEASPDEPCSRTHSETLQRARSYYGQHGGAYNVVNDTQTRNLYLVVAFVSGVVALSQLRRARSASSSSRGTASGGRSMTKWLWYFGWLIGWFVLFSFVFVPIPNPLLRGLTLTLAWVLLFYGFRFINRRFRAEEVDQSVRDGSLGAAGSGISEREAAFIAAAREPTLSTGATQSISDGPHAATSLRTASDVERHSIHQVTVVGGVMKSAGNPLVRRAFAQAMKEVETKTYDTGLWAMALVECNGDERLARLAYMKARAADIAWADAKTAESAQQTRNAK